MKATPRETQCARCRTVVTVSDTAGAICRACGNEYIPYPQTTKAQEQAVYAIEIVASVALVVALTFVIFIMWYAGIF